MRDDTASEPSLLSTDGLARVYPGGKGVFDISLKLNAGEVLGLMGPNGSGKTTLLRLLATAATPTAGRISWFGNRNGRDPSVRRRLGIMLDQPAHFEQMTGYQNAWFFARQFGLSEGFARERLDELFNWSGLWEAKDQLVAEYSLGMKRRLNLTEALVHRPSILLLDEPSLALDYRGELELIERLQLLSLTGTAIVLATNDVHLAERLCDYVVFLHGGRVIREGRVPDLLTEVAGSKEVELQLNSPVALESLRELEGVEAASVEGDVVHVVLARGANPAQVLAVLDGTADLVSTMRVRRPNLGDLFLKLTGVALPVAHR
ncbi:MAG TPA: ABC transporter ATP-binding protein [Candidatus Dormibacteraeota bacterium]|jgi:ABC-type multidrug transport system ATPase subunit|nr:ABC transporter ATP-binding protein [Candidatus Dormibacteraeota bacterium]